MICVLQLDQDTLAEQNKRIQLPDYLLVDKEITDLVEYQPKALSKKLEEQIKQNGENEEKKSSGDEK